MPQFFLPPGAKTGKSFHLAGEEAFHISKVLRHQPGDTLELFDGRGGRYQGKITRLNSEGVEGVLTATLDSPHKASRVNLNLYQSLLKTAHWEWVLEKGTEIGVTRFIPVTTARTVVLLKDAERTQAKGDRWKKIVMASAKQCGRADLPEVDAPLPFRDALKQAERRTSDSGAEEERRQRDSTITLFAWEKLAGATAQETLKKALEVHVHHPSLSLREREIKNNPLPREGEGGVRGSAMRGSLTVNLFVGPEGGFTEEEIELAEFHKANFFALGSNILRGETAAIASATLILYELGSL